MTEENLIVVSTRISYEEKKLLDNMVNAGVEETRSKVVRKLMLMGIDASLDKIEKKDEPVKEEPKEEEPVKDESKEAAE